MPQYSVHTTLTDRALPAHVFIPAQVQHPLLVLVHGLGTKPERLAQYACKLAGRYGVPLLVPDFSSPQFKGYQRLKGLGLPHGSAHALIAAVQKAVALHELPSSRFDLMGFSAGAQFAHRFALHYPSHLRSLTVASPGWYTLLDHDTAYPFGLENADHSPSEQDICRFLNLPIMIAVGEADTGRDKHLRISPHLDMNQGLNRLQRARHWHQHLHAMAHERAVCGQYDFVTLPQTAHSIDQAVKSGGLIQQLFRFVLTNRVPLLTPDMPSRKTSALSPEEAAVHGSRLTESLA